MENKGILLLSFGKRGYGFLAYNMAVSIRHFNKTIPIFLLHDEKSLEQLHPHQLNIFTDSKKIEINYKNPGLTKISALLHSPFENTLFIDVDTCCMRDIEPILDRCIESKQDFATIVTDYYSLVDGDDSHKINWVYGTELFQHYKLDKLASVPVTNTSVIYFNKSERAKNILNKILSGFDFPFEKLKLSWGNSMPDEVPMSAALVGEKNIELSKDTIIFGNKVIEDTDEQMKNKFFMLSVYGGKNFIRPRFNQSYDRFMMEFYRARGEDFQYKYHLSIEDKQANRSTQVMVKQRPEQKDDSLFHSAVIPVSESVLIDSTKLIQSYAGPRNEKVNVTNWFNCSFIEFKGKRYFAYRMESYPFCTRMKIGICLMDENFQPIQESNVLLNLKSDVNGFRAEDPRLFIFNDELYLSYLTPDATNRFIQGHVSLGHSMGQAKINPETLQAEESFYIEKPDINRVEKNWTFFESDQKLYCVYNTSPHTIFKMDREKWTQVYQTSFAHNWKWGEPRGGTSPIKVGGFYWSFFHSALNIKYKGNVGRQYFMGAYAFNDFAPFAPVFMSKEPLMAGEVISEAIHRLSNKIFVVFPSGAIREPEGWKISFGCNDLECRMITISDSVLENNLIPIQYENEKKELLESSEVGTGQVQGM